MKKLNLILSMAVMASVFTGCKNENQEMAQKDLDSYKSYVDSVSNVASAEAAANWDAIEANYDKAKMNAENAAANAADKESFQKNLDEASMKYDEYKAKVVAEKEKMDMDNAKMAMKKSLLGDSFDGNDMSFAWVNKDNILSVYDNFVNTVADNKDSYSREDWDEIKLMYEALDTRKNTVEKEGLTTSDNLKIAGLKVKFAPMYAANRVSAKSDENAEAKQ